jgi:hypothetical protein
MKIETISKPGIPVDKFIVKNVLISATKQGGEYRFGVRYTLGLKKDPNEISEVSTDFLQEMLPEDTTTIYSLNLPVKHFIGEKVYRRLSNKTVPGIVTQVIYDGQLCSYMVQFSDDREEEFCEEHKLCINTKDVMYPQDIEDASSPDLFF